MATLSPSPSLPAALRRARFATCLMFLLCGLSVATWAPMIPFVKARLGLDERELGFILLAFGVGAMVTMPFSGVLINRFGSRATMAAAVVVFSAALPGLAWSPGRGWLAGFLVVFGAGVGMLDVSMNAHAVVVERRYGRPIMSFFHGIYSVGGVVGPLGIIALLRRGVPVWACAAGVACLLVAAAAWQFRRLLPHAEDDTMEGSPLRLPSGAVALLGTLCFIAFLSEGAVLDWMAVFLRDFRGMEAASAGIGYAVFSVAMTIGRLTGDRVAHWLGPVTTLRYGALLAAAGYGVAVLVPAAWATVAMMALVGLGLSNMAPLLFSATGRMKDPPPSVSIPAITTMGYAGLLTGPAAIGFAGQATSLALALGGVAVALLVIAACAKRAEG